MSPYLSIIAASRNDDHGGDPLIRTQIFVNCFSRQCDKFKLPAEIILVDWNPVVGRPGLEKVLTLPHKSSYCTARVVTVPGEMHETLKYSGNLPLFQMIAKNVGIRRAKGDFVLATNIDIIFSDELIEFIAKRRLDPKRMYRVDRYDIRADLPADVDLDTVLDRAWKSVIRTNIRSSLPELTDHLYGGEPARRDCSALASMWDQKKGKVPVTEDGQTWEDLKGIRVANIDGAWAIEAQLGCPFEHLNTNACGDFKMLSKEGWAAIRGYPDFEAYSFNIDSMGLIMAHYHGLQETSLLAPCVCFHIEHALGSGWTPEGAQKLFNRLSEKRILNPEWYLFLDWFAQMRKERKAIPFNRDDWGLKNYYLEERELGSGRLLNGNEKKSNLIAGSVGSLYPVYDLDHVALFYEREARAAAVQTEVQPVPAQSVPIQSSLLPDATHFHHLNDLFDHDRGGITIAQHFQSDPFAKSRSLVVWAPQEDYPLIRSALTTDLVREVISGEAPLSNNGSGLQHSQSHDGFLLATNPQGLIMRLNRYKLLVPRSDNPKLLIWILSQDPVPLLFIRWLSSIKLARRLLGDAGWRVAVECQTQLC